MKLVVVLNEDLGMSPGKAVSQGIHAAIGARRKCKISRWREWEREGEAVIVLKSNNVSAVIADAKKRFLPVAQIEDEGKTEVKYGALTAIAIGPCADERIDAVTKNLKLY